MNPSVSVIVVGGRSPLALERCLGALQVAGHRVPLQILVVDHGSADGIVERLAALDPQVEVVAEGVAPGLARAVNRGFGRARSDYLLVLDADCRVTAEAIERLLQVLRERPQVAAVGPQLVDEHGRTIRSCGRFPGLWTLLCDHLGPARWFPDSPLFGGSRYGAASPESLDQVDWACGAALLIKRRAQRMVGGLDENLLMSMGDVDWCRRASRLGFAVRYVPDARVERLGHASTRPLAQTYLHGLRSRVHYFRKHHGKRVALGAKLILLLSLILKWCACASRFARHAPSGVYAAGLEVVWQA
jgi:N-acetylglucosaminyl-diphospho-decaprenol L-rhamnosyltransferase